MNGGQEVHTCRKALAVRSLRASVIFTVSRKPFHSLDHGGNPKLSLALLEEPSPLSFVLNISYVINLLSQSRRGSHCSTGCWNHENASFLPNDTCTSSSGVGMWRNIPFDGRVQCHVSSMQ